MRTLIIACSATKRHDIGLMRAVDRYDGPAYRTLRANRPHVDELRVLILSAEHGLIAADECIADYDRKLDEARAGELHDELVLRLRQLRQIDGMGVRLHIHGGKLYRQAIQHAIAEAGLPTDRQRVTYSSGGIGDQLGQLRHFLTKEGRRNG